MKSPRQEVKAITRHLLPLNGACCAGNDLYLIKLLAKQLDRNPKALRLMPRLFISCFSQTDAKTLLLKTTKTTQ